MADPFETGDGISVTIKYDKGYEATWVNFRGSAASVRQQINDFFGFNAEETASLSLHLLTVEAEQVAHGVGTVAGKLGGRPVKDGTPNPAPASEQPASRPADSAPGANDRDPIFGEIDQITDTEELRNFYAKNQKTFAVNPEALAHWKAHGRELQKKAAA